MDMVCRDGVSRWRVETSETAFDACRRYRPNIARMDKQSSLGPRRRTTSCPGFRLRHLRTRVALCRLPGCAVEHIETPWHKACFRDREPFVTEPDSHNLDTQPQRTLPSVVRPCHSHSHSSQAYASSAVLYSAQDRGLSAVRVLCCDRGGRRARAARHAVSCSAGC